MKKISNYWILNFLLSGLIIILNTSCKAENQPDSKSVETIKDMDGNVYHTVKIGTQVWMVENLKTRKYNDGTQIPFVTDNSAWSTLHTPGYCWYSNDAETNKDTYGALYNWYTVNTGKLAPIGWHIPSDIEWTNLEDYLKANGYNYDDTRTNNYGKSLAATTNWKTFTSTDWDLISLIGNDLTKNNRTGFSALPGGTRNIYGTFYSIGESCYLWSSTEHLTDSSWSRALNYQGCSLGKDDDDNKSGNSVRCIRN